MMEIACTPDRVATAKKCFMESKITLWTEEMNPILAPDTPAQDMSIQAAKKYIES